MAQLKKADAVYGGAQRDVEDQPKRRMALVLSPVVQANGGGLGMEYISMRTGTFLEYFNCGHDAIPWVRSYRFPVDCKDEVIVQALLPTDPQDQVTLSMHGVVFEVVVDEPKDTLARTIRGQITQIFALAKRLQTKDSSETLLSTAADAGYYILNGDTSPLLLNDQELAETRAHLLATQARQLAQPFYREETQARLASILAQLGELLPPHSD